MFSGGDAGGVTPVPIPNTEVKSTEADDTWTARSWESRKSPDFRTLGANPPGVFYCEAAESRRGND